MSRSAFSFNTVLLTRVPLVSGFAQRLPASRKFVQSRIHRASREKFPSTGSTAFVPPGQLGALQPLPRFGPFRRCSLRHGQSRKLPDGWCWG